MSPYRPEKTSIKRGAEGQNRQLNLLFRKKKKEADGGEGSGGDGGDEGKDERKRKRKTKKEEPMMFEPVF